MVKRAKEKVGERAIHYEFHYDDVNWYVEQNKTPRLIDELLDLVHKEWIDSDADEVGPLGPNGAEGEYWIKISIVDVPVMREKSAKGAAGATAQSLEGESFLPKLRAKLARLSPERRAKRIVAEFSAYAADYPEKVKALADNLVQVADRFRPPDPRRVLGMSDAIRITGLSEPRIKQIAREGRIGEKQGKRWAFSEAELLLLAKNPRSVGRPTKILEAEKNLSKNR